MEKSPKGTNEIRFHQGVFAKLTSPESKSPTIKLCAAFYNNFHTGSECCGKDISLGHEHKCDLQGKKKQ